MTQECLSPIEVKAIRIIANAHHNQTPDNILIGQLYRLANSYKQQGHDDHYQAISRIIEYISKA